MTAIQHPQILAWNIPQIFQSIAELSRTWRILEAQGKGGDLSCKWCSLYTKDKCWIPVALNSRLENHVHQGGSSGLIKGAASSRSHCRKLEPQDQNQGHPQWGWMEGKESRITASLYVTLQPQLVRPTHTFWKPPDRHCLLLLTAKGVEHLQSKHKPSPKRQMSNSNLRCFYHRF